MTASNDPRAAAHLTAMSDQPTSETDPIVSSLRREFREDYLRLANDIAAFDQKIAALQRSRRTLIEERQAIIDMAATDTTDDTVLVALRKSGRVAAQRLVDEARAISWHLYDTIEFSATGTEENFVGPYVSLMQHKTRPLADVDPQVLAAALVEFARRFCPTPPETGERAGFVCGDIMTEGEGLTFLYKPDGTEATLFIGRTREVTGTLVEVAQAAINQAKADARHDRFDEDGDDY